MPNCFVCGSDKPRKAFSKHQLRKSADVRKCRKCSSNSGNSELHNLLTKEKNALKVLLEKKEQVLKKIAELHNKLKGLVCREEKDMLPVPVLDDMVYKKARSDEKKRQLRAAARGEDYIPNPMNRRIIELHKKIADIKAENDKIRDTNREIYWDNLHLRHERSAIRREIKRTRKSMLGVYINEAEKNIRYLRYAIDHNLSMITMDSLIYKCNMHRNTYIAKAAFKKWATSQDGRAPGSSKCYKYDLRCSSYMHYTSYKSAECECGTARWYLEDPGKDFDINGTYAVGGYTGSAYFSVHI